LFFCFQGQNEVANPAILFHEQTEPFIPQAIKDTLPFFLGAVDNDEVQKRADLKRLQTELRKALADQEELKKIVGQGIGRAKLLLQEAIAVGLLEKAAAAEVTDINGAIDLLGVIRKGGLRKPELPSSIDASLRELRQLKSNVVQKIDDLKDEKSFLLSFVETEEEYSTEVREQKSRLASLALMENGKTDEDMTPCPVCASPLEMSAHAENQVVKHLKELTAELETVETSQPLIAKAIESVEGKLKVARLEYSELLEGIKNLLAQDEYARTVQAEQDQRAMILGKVSLYLEGAQKSKEIKLSNEGIDLMKRKIAGLESQLDVLNKEERVRALLNIVSKRITDWADDLDLEHKGYPLYLDLNRLELIMDTEEGSVSLKQIGSGKNWVNYHLLLYFSLQQTFIDKKSCVPSFVLFDQPTQVFFPPDKKSRGKLAEIGKDEDRKAVIQMFELMKKRVELAKGKLQVIVTDHADIEGAWFEECVVERWRGGKALIPSDWDTPSKV
jgi:hypothetical protein